MAELDCEIHIGTGFATLANRRLIVEAIAKFAKEEFPLDRHVSV